MSKRLVILILLLSSLLISGQNKRLRNIDDGTIVYNIPGTEFFHLSGCAELKGEKITLTYISAKDKHLKPCPFCMFIVDQQSPNLFPKTERPAQFIPNNKLPKINKVGSFRQTKWGMTTDQVKALESSHFIGDQTGSDGLKIKVYEGKIGEFNAAIGYYFAEGQLVEGRYLVSDKHVNKNLHLLDFEKIKQNLIEKYGQPQSDEHLWLNDLYKTDPNEWGTAVSAGHLVLQAEWSLLDTAILLMLKGDNFDSTLSVDYSSTDEAHLGLRKKAQTKAQQSIW
jgi:hypothetical protein